jgi:hypothetical protein
MAVTEAPPVFGTVAAGVTSVTNVDGVDYVLGTVRVFGVDTAVAAEVGTAGEALMVRGNLVRVGEPIGSTGWREIFAAQSNAIGGHYPTDADPLEENLQTRNATVWLNGPNTATAAGR